jgi:predicted ATPase with chaperone activity
MRRELGETLHQKTWRVLLAVSSRWIRLAEVSNGFKHLCYLRVQELAWTIADLGGREVPGRDELAIALAMRHGEQPGAVRREAVGP